MKIIFGVFGRIGSGKDSVSNYLVKKHFFYKIHMGNILRALARKAKIKITRENLQKLQEKYHKKYGHDFLLNIALEKAKGSKKQRIVVPGIRTPEQAARFKKEKNAKLIFVDAKPEIRFERTKKRNRKGSAKTIDEFKKQEKQEEKYFKFDKILRYSDYKLNNNGTEKDLYKQIDKLIKR